MAKPHLSFYLVLFFLLIPLFQCFSVFAEENQDVKNEPLVSAVKIEGLGRTKESYMLSVLGKYVGIPESRIDLHEVKVTLEELELFSETEVSLQKDENGAIVLFVKVKEKWSFIPIPFFMYSSSTGFMGGAFVMDMNAFGIKDNYVVGGVFSKNIQLALMAYSRPSRDIRHPGFTVGASFIRRDNEEKNLSGKKIFEYNAMGGSVYAAVSDKITAHSKINAGLRYSYTNAGVKKKYAEYKEKVKSFHAITPGVGWDISFSSLNEWFLSVKSFSIDGAVTVLASGSCAESLGFKFTIQYPLPVTRLRVLTQYALYLSNNLPVPLRPTQMVVGTTIMPDKFHGTKMGGADFGLEVGILNTKFVMFSAYGLLEQFAGEDSDGSFVMNFGYSTGLKMYLKKLAIPAIAVGVSHNLMQNEIKFSATIGMGGF